MREAITVSQLNRYIKELIIDDTILNNVLIKGEVSNLKESRGNYYFILKDSASSIQCIVFTNFSGANVDVRTIKDGLEFLVEGKVQVYEKNGTYAVYVTKVTNVGLGDYFVRLEELKQKLYELGMFDDSYKKAIPKYSNKIGVVTAKNGAAIKDIYKTIKDKNPYAEIILYPAVVQGDSAYQSIIEGIMALDNMDLDVIIVGRGGGAVEDLYAFNDERVAYAIFNAKTPIISAVGHEINDSISDLVADVRVATPTAAGELATFDYAEFIGELEDYKLELDNCIEDKILKLRSKLNTIADNLTYLSPRSKISRFHEMAQSRSDKLNYIIKTKIENLSVRIAHYIEILNSYNVLNKMKQGLVYASDKRNKKLLSINQVSVGDRIKLRLKDGVIDSSVLKVIKDEL